ncbi:hypothetical protein PG988_010188 [Apiospora saccharicola]
MPKPMTPNRNTAVTFVGDGMQGAIPSPEEDLADPATTTITMAVPDGEVTCSLETGWDVMESAPASLASSVLHDQDDTSDVPGGIRKAPLISETNLDAYFSKIHPFWSILHAPTFRIDKASDILLASMTMLADRLCGGSDHLHSCTAVFEAAATSQLLADPGLNALQALFLCVVYATYRLLEDDALAAWITQEHLHRYGFVLSMGWMWLEVDD